MYCTAQATHNAGATYMLANVVATECVQTCTALLRLLIMQV